MPPSASSISPFLVDLASVKAPFSWPNSSLSNSVSVIAAQLTSMNGELRRALSKWSPRATSSLPVPLSPCTRIVWASLWASCVMTSRSRRVVDDSPMICDVRYLPSCNPCRRVISRRALTSSSARVTEMRSFSR